MRSPRRTVLSVLSLLTLLVALAALTETTIAIAADVDSSSIKKASKLYDKGQRALAAGSVEEAREYFDQALERVPGFPEAEIGLGNIAMASGSFEQAYNHYMRAKDGYGDVGEAMLQVRMKRYTAARDQIRQIEDTMRELQSSNRATEGNPASMDLAKYDAQIRQLQAIEPPDPEETGAPGEIYFYIGNAEFRLGRTNEAILSWEECRDKSPDFPMVYNNLALAYWRAGRIDEARASLIKAEELGFNVHPQFKKDLMGG